VEVKELHRKILWFRPGVLTFVRRRLGRIGFDVSILGLELGGAFKIATNTTWTLARACRGRFAFQLSSQYWGGIHLTGKRALLMRIKPMDIRRKIFPRLDERIQPTAS
jgi:hypothetical protein